ncbi:hypothetical protein [Sphingobacterium faecium]|nr:hypothetical protein [Sphingobacterium faecium]MDH5828245.1 hypothetical protein [Sphingobacterium faecium]
MKIIFIYFYLLFFYGQYANGWDKTVFHIYDIADTIYHGIFYV